MLNKQKGNMYGFVTHTWNPIKGKCPHNCSYCYMRIFPQKELRLSEKDLNDNIGENNFIFVGSSTDMWADKVPNEWIERTLVHCREYPKNTYLFQTKNPKRFKQFQNMFPDNTIIGITLETNRESDLDNCPSRKERVEYFSYNFPLLKRKMVTIEPIMDFEVEPFCDLIKRINPEFINIGADSKKSKLKEPSWFKVTNLISELKKFTRINQKKNLDRLIEEKQK